MRACPVIVLAGVMLLRCIPRAASPDSPPSCWRALAADYCWLRANIAWEARDEVMLRGWIDLTLLFSQTTDYFRINAARMLAYDVPAWRVAVANAPAALREAWRGAAASEAIGLLDVEESTAERMVEAAAIALYGKRDRVEAARLIRAAAEMPNAPWHAGRIHARLLEELGQDEAALDWLESWLPRLPADNPLAQRAAVEREIARLKASIADRRQRSAP